MFQIVIDNKNIVKVDKTFKSTYCSRWIDGFFDLAYSFELEANSAKFNAVVKLEDISGAVRYAFLECENKKNKIYANGVDVTSDIGEILTMRQKYGIVSSTKLGNAYTLDEHCKHKLKKYFDSLLVFRISIINLEEYSLMLGKAFKTIIFNKVAEMVVSVFGKDTTYQISDFEFIVMKKGGDLYLEEIAKMALSQIKTVFTIEDRNVMLDIRIGIVDFRNYSGDINYQIIDTSTRLAVEKASRSKSARSFVLSYYTDRIPTDFSKQGVIEQMIKRDQFDVYYQPQVDLKTNKIIGLEALTRIIGEDKKDITTAELIAISEKCGGILPLGEFIYKKALSFAKTLQTQGQDVEIAINVSTIQLLERGFVTAFTNYARSLNLDTSKINIEITETAMMYSVDAILPKLSQLIQFGFNIHIDDFGTGYSSLSYLASLPANCIKIDRGFVDKLIDDSYSIIVSGAIMIAKSLRKKVIAEGVETQKQVDILRKINCDIIQGYIIAKAMSEKETLSFLLDYVKKEA
ncbi:MAG: EAL domain-containing protein [Clostridia bacterium]